MSTTLSVLRNVMSSVKITFPIFISKLKALEKTGL